MADNRNTNLFSRIRSYGVGLSDYLDRLTQIGVKYDDVGQSLGVPRSKTEEEEGYASLYNYLDDNDRLIDIDTVPYYRRDYNLRLKEIRDISGNPEIERLTHGITNESIVSDANGNFYSVSLNGNNGAKYDKKIVDTVEKESLRLNSLWEFNKDNNGWSMFLKFIEEGYLAYEIIWDDIKNPTTIVGFQELEPSTLIPILMDKVIEEDGEKTTIKVKAWKQLVKYNRRNAQTYDTSQVRTIPDESMLFISYSRTPGNNRRFSYVERLIRSFNMMRTVENCMVAWYVMNSQSRLKIVVPVSGRNTTRAKLALSKIKNKYKEDVNIDASTGELTVNGKPHINFSKTLILPSRGGSSPDIDGINFNGPDLSRMEPVKYFERKLQKDSGWPLSKYDSDNGGGPAIEFNSRNELTHDEKAYYLFINRLRTEFSKLIRLPIYRQCLLKHPDLSIDRDFESSITINFNGDNKMIDSIKLHSKLEKLDSFDKFSRLSDSNNNPIYNTKYLMVNMLGIMTDEEWDTNQKMNKKDKESEDGDL